jgi:hypothetical protein
MRSGAAPRCKLECAGTERREDATVGWNRRDALIELVQVAGQPLQRLSVAEAGRFDEWCVA